MTSGGPADRALCRVPRFRSRLPVLLLWADRGRRGHHPLDGGSTAAKPTDLNAVPLCGECHRGEWHRTGSLPGMDARQTAEWLATRVRWLNQRWIADKKRD